jgi:integrase
MKGSVKRRGKNWAIIYDAPRGDDGKRNQKWESVKGTKKDAEKLLAQRIHEASTGGFISSSDTTVGHYLDEWIKNVRHRVSGTTPETYQQNIRVHIKPAIGHRRLDALKPAHIQSMYTKLIDASKLAPKSVRLIHAIVHTALKDAVKVQIMTRNPADAVTPPRVGRVERPTLTEDEVNRLLEVGWGTVYYIPILLASGAGLRRNEILALKWSDVDLEKQRLFVRHSLVQTKSGISFKEPKSGKSRTLKLGEVITGELQAHYDNQRLRRAVGGEYNPDNLVCCQDDGTMFPPKRFSSQWKKVLVKSGVKTVTFHDLRHTYAKFVISSGTHMKVLCELLGHASITTSYDLYGHVTESMQDGAASHIDSVIKRPKRRIE